MAAPRHDRLCLTIGAGIGKTKTAEQVCYLRQQCDPGHLALFLDVSELPEHVDRYLDESGTSLLIDKFREAETTRHAPRDQVLRLVQRKIHERRFTVVVDALDQIDLNDDRRARQLIRQLAVFLKRQPGIRCVVTGRPYAIQHFWRELFDAGIGGWKFAQVAEFDEDEVQNYLGQRFNELQRLEADLLSVPRFLERLRTLPVGRLRQLRTAADVYWVSLRPLLEAGCNRQPVPPGFFETAIALLAVLAFEMTRQRKFVRVRPGGQGFDALRVAAWNNGQPALRSLKITTLREFDEALRQLASLNVGIEHALLDNHRLNEIHWQDRTLQAFLAGVWVTRFAGDADRRWLGENRYVGDDESMEAFEEMWRFATGMPGDERLFPDAHHVWDEQTWVTAMSLLLTAGTQSSPRARPTEMIYRGWPGMLRLAGFLEEPRWNEPEHLVPATAAAQQAARRVVEGSKSDETASSRPINAQARAALFTFLGEFPHLLVATDERGRIAYEFESGFVDLPGGKFWSDHEGNEPDNIPEPFRMAKYPVTNELYALFDPEHQARIAIYRKYSSSPRCPALRVDWYDAWCVATWLHSRLPDEFEWEYACRGQHWPDQGAGPPRMPWCFGDYEERLSRYAWYRKNSGHCANPVGQKLPNAFGLYDMHGNVWEWTSSLYHDDDEVSDSRVVRGGSFSSGAGVCRTAFSLHFLPTYADDNNGVRVSRTRRT